MRTLIISAAARKGGTIDRACKAYAEKSEKAECINLFDYNIKPCRGCLACVKGKTCNIDDDFKNLYQKMLDSDHIVIGSPIYSHSTPGILKVFIDRCSTNAIAYVDVDVNANWRDKLKKVRLYQKQSAEISPFKGKTFTTITSCATPSKNNKDMKSINLSLHQFIEEDMKGKITEDIRYPDTLFQFKRIEI